MTIAARMRRHSDKGTRRGRSSGHPSRSAFSSAARAMARSWIASPVESKTVISSSLSRPEASPARRRRAGSLARVPALPGQNVGPLRDNDNKAVLGKDGKKVAQVSDRASGAILEGVPSEVEAQASKVLKESGRGGTGRYVVGEGDVDNARELILAAHAAHAKAIHAKQASKPKVASGKRARSRA